jgi:GNAT superfamily N-acetyltransferase
MISWNCEPQPPEIIGPWLLWKLLIDQRYQGRGYAAAVVRQVAELVRAEGATELLTSYAPEDDWFAGFCQRLGFVPTRRVRRQRRDHRAARVDLGVVLPVSADVTSRESRLARRARV